MPAQHQVVENGHLREQLDVLEGAGDAQVCDAMRLQADQVLAAEADRARVGLVEPRDAVEDGRLAGSVGADHGEDLAVVDREADTLDGLDRLEGELEVLDLEDGVVAPARSTTAADGLSRATSSAAIVLDLGEGGDLAVETG